MSIIILDFLIKPPIQINCNVFTIYFVRRKYFLSEFKFLLNYLAHQGQGQTSVHSAAFSQNQVFLLIIHERRKHIFSKPVGLKILIDSNVPNNLQCYKLYLIPNITNEKIKNYPFSYEFIGQCLYNGVSESFNNTNPNKSDLRKLFGVIFMFLNFNKEITFYEQYA